MLHHRQTGGGGTLPESAGGSNLASDSSRDRTHCEWKTDQKKELMSEKELALMSAAERLEQLGVQFERILKRSRSLPEPYLTNKRPKPLSLTRSSLSDPTRASAFSPGASIYATKAQNDGSNDDQHAMDLHLLACVATSTSVTPIRASFSPHIITLDSNVAMKQPTTGFVLDWLLVRVNTVLKALRRMDGYNQSGQNNIYQCNTRT